MRNPYEMLYKKEKQLQQIRQEIEVLRTVLPLLADDGDRSAHGGASGNVIVWPGRGSAGAD
jgi:hypothetical protein